MNLIEQYQTLVNDKNWTEATRVIRQIIERNPEIDTSWFNYGVCLDEIGDHAEAAKAFLRAHELNVRDYGIHFRFLRSLYLCGDYSQFIEFADYICCTFREEIPTLFESDAFPAVAQLPAFIELRRKYLV